MQCLGSEGQSSLYILRTNDGANISIRATVSFTKGMKSLTTPPLAFTIYIELILGEPSLTKYVETLRRLKIQYSGIRP